MKNNITIEQLYEWLISRIENEGQKLSLEPSREHKKVVETKVKAFKEVKNIIDNRL